MFCSLVLLFSGQMKSSFFFFLSFWFFVCLFVFAFVFEELRKALISKYLGRIQNTTLWAPVFHNNCAWEIFDFLGNIILGVEAQI
jgi:hypothetical protein